MLGLRRWLGGTPLLIILLTFVLLAVAACATTGGDGPDTNIKQFVRADIQAALKIAQASGDTAGINCMSVLLKRMPENVDAVKATGAVSLYMQARQTRRAIDKGISEEVHLACAPLIVDAERVLAKLGLIAIPGAGLLPLR